MMYGCFLYNVDVVYVYGIYFVMSLVFQCVDYVIGMVSVYCFLFYCELQ